MLIVVLNGQNPQMLDGKNRQISRWWSTDAADVLIEMYSVLDWVGAWQRVEVVRLEHFLARLLGWQARWRAGEANSVDEARVTHHIEVVPRPSPISRCSTRPVTPTCRWQAANIQRTFTDLGV